MTISEVYPDKRFEKLCALYKSRKHGAATSRGIEYQVLVAVDYALDVLGDGPCRQLALEAIEDIDVVGETRTYVQAKRWEKVYWGNFCSAFEKFAKVLHETPDGVFEYVVDGILDKTLKKLSEKDEYPLDPGELGSCAAKIRKYCPKGVDARKIIRDQVVVRSISREKLWERSVYRVAGLMKTSTEGAELYLFFLTSHLLEWSGQRRVLDASDLQQVLDKAKTAAAKESAGYAALNNGAISPVLWDEDEAPQDFFAGKAVRPGHVVANLDLYRPKWHQQIKRGLIDSRVCVVRASSGQGKSTLMFRYAFDEFEAGTTFILTSAQTSEELKSAIDFLETKRRLGRVVNLLVDGGDWRTQRWSEVAKKCGALGFSVIVAARNEDIQRYSDQIGFRISEVVPALDFREAEEIRDMLVERDQVHPNAPAAGQAFELLGEPRLLMEYVYLLTHGELLADRLKSQVNEIERRDGHRGGAKVDALRIVSLAHALGVPVDAERLIAKMGEAHDARSVLRTLDDEYLVVRDGMVEGLHWVRSDHLVHILHGHYVREGRTLGQVLASIPDWAVEAVVAAALFRARDEPDDIIEIITNWALRGGAARLVRVLDGCFKTGARLSALENKRVFEKAFQLVGMPSVTILGIACSITHQNRDLFEGMSDQGVMPQLRELRHELGENLHFKYVHAVFTVVGYRLTEILNDASTCNVGRLLDWAYLTGFEVLSWPSIAPKLLEQVSPDEEEIDDLAWFCQGFGRLDSRRFAEWFGGDRELFARLIRETGAVGLSIDDEAVKLEFLVTPVSDFDDLNDEAVRRLRLLRRCFPNSQVYCSQGVSVVEEGELANSIFSVEQQTHKAIQSENLPLQSDVEKNTTISNAIQQNFELATFFEYAAYWGRLRETVTEFVMLQARQVHMDLAGRRMRKRPAEDNLAGDAAVLLRGRPPIGSTVPEALYTLEKEANNWASSVLSFFQQLRNEPPNYKNLALLMSEILKMLPGLDKFYGSLERHVVGFNFDLDQEQERKAYGDILEFITALDGDYREGARSILELRKRRRQRDKRLATSIREKLLLAMPAMEIVVGDSPFELDGLRYLAVTFEVSEVEKLEVLLNSLIDHLPSTDENLISYILIPTQNGCRIIEQAYRVFPYAGGEEQDEESERLRWSFGLIPAAALKSLPEMPLVPDPKLLIYGVRYALIQTGITLLRWREKIAQIEESPNNLGSELAAEQQVQLSLWLKKIVADWSGDRVRLIEQSVLVTALEPLDDAVASFERSESEGTGDVVAALAAIGERL